MKNSLPSVVAAIERGISENLHLGAQLYVSVRGEVVADFGIGEAKAGIPLTSDHLMLWMSSVKPVTAIAISQMWERGRLDPDDLISRHIPEFRCKGKEPITISHVLTHRGGFPKAAYQWASATEPWGKIIAEICAAELEPGWVVGRDSGYHVASGWYILAEIVRRLDGRPYSRYVREEIFEPLGMKDSWLGEMPPERYREYGQRIVPMHGRIAPNSKPIEFKPEFPPPSRFWSGSQESCSICRPGGSAWGPIRELGRFYEALLGSGNGIVRPETIEAITARESVGEVDRTFNFKLDRGLGVVLDSKQYGIQSAWYGRQCSPRAFGHAGAWSSVGFADPEYNLAVALVFNGMTLNEPAKNDERMFATISAIYEELQLANESGKVPA